MAFVVSSPVVIACDSFRENAKLDRFILFDLGIFTAFGARFGRSVIRWKHGCDPALITAIGIVN
jgi:hypothetical protein